MSTITQLICNKFGGIRQKNAIFSEELITAQDLQNVELYFTGTNGGVGIRTTKGNISINNDLKNQEFGLEEYSKDLVNNIRPLSAKKMNKIKGEYVNDNFINTVYFSSIKKGVCSKFPNTIFSLKFF